VTPRAERELRDALGMGPDDGDTPTAPKNEDGSRYVVHCPDYYNAAADAADLDEALERAWVGVRTYESRVIIWDYCGDTAAYDPTATPHAVGVLRVQWLEGDG